MPHYVAIRLSILPYPFLSSKKQQNPVGDYFCQGEIEEPVYDKIFSNHLLLNTHSNQEHDNAKLHPPNPERLEQLVEQIIHSVPV